jgi:hypothetical protein
MNPTLLALGITAGGLALLDYRTLGLLESRVYFGELRAIFDLDTEMIHAGGSGAPANREIHPRVLKHPFGVVILSDRGLGVEKFSVEADRGWNVFDADMNMESFHNSPMCKSRLIMNAELAGQRLANSIAMVAHGS